MYTSQIPFCSVLHWSLERCSQISSSVLGFFSPSSPSSYFSQGFGPIIFVKSFDIIRRKETVSSNSFLSLMTSLTDFQKYTGHWSQRDQILSFSSDVHLRCSCVQKQSANHSSLHCTSLRASVNLSVHKTKIRHNVSQMLNFCFSKKLCMHHSSEILDRMRPESHVLHYTGHWTTKYGDSQKLVFYSSSASHQSTVMLMTLLDSWVVLISSNFWWTPVEIPHVPLYALLTLFFLNIFSTLSPPPSSFFTVDDGSGILSAFSSAQHLQTSAHMLRTIFRPPGLLFQELSWTLLCALSRIHVLSRAGFLEPMRFPTRPVRFLPRLTTFSTLFLLPTSKSNRYLWL